MEAIHELKYHIWSPIDSIDDGYNRINRVKIFQVPYLGEISTLMVKSSQTKQKIHQRIIETSSQMMVKGSVREFPQNALII